MFGLFKTKPQSMSPERAEKIVNEYGAAMMKKPTMVTDERSLPHSKADIKEAIRILVRLTADDPTFVDQLRAGYVSLADFQPLTSREKAIVAQFDASARAMPDMSDPKALAAYIAMFEEYQSLTGRVADEGKVLLSEISGSA